MCLHDLHSSSTRTDNRQLLHPIIPRPRVGFLRLRHDFCLKMSASRFSSFSSPILSIPSGSGFAFPKLRILKGLYLKLVFVTRSLLVSARYSAISAIGCTPNGFLISLLLTWSSSVHLLTDYAGPALVVLWPRTLTTNKFARTALRSLP